MYASFENVLLTMHSKVQKFIRSALDL